MTHKAAPRKLLTRILAVGISTTLLWACNGGSDASPTTTPSTPAPSIAAPTTVATTTTTPPTTAAPTTTATTTTPPTTAAAATTIGGTPEEVAKAEVLQTLDAFWTDVDACFAAPNDCDSDLIIATYTDGSAENPMALWLQSWVTDLRGLDQWVAKPERIQYELDEVQVVDTNFIVTAQCVTDSSEIVGRDGTGTTVIDNQTGYAYFRFNWIESAGRRIITGGDYGDIEPGTSNPCDF